MYAAKRQIRIWGHELREAWGAIPFMGRVLLGAAISLTLALVCVKKAIKPLNAELVELNKGVVVPENLDPEKDEEIIMNLDRADKLQSSLKSWKERLAAVKDNAAVLKPEVHLDVIRELQTTLDQCGLVLVSEKLVSQKGTPDGPLRRFTHAYEVRGGFRSVQAMLLLVEEMPWRMELRNLALVPAEGALSTLQLTFTLDIYYLAE